MRNFGKTYKKLRKDRNLTQEDVAGSQLSVAQVSKFERGDSRVTLENFYYMVEKLGLTLQEFEHRALGNELNGFYQLLEQLSIYYAESNERGLRKLLLDERKKIDFGGFHHELNCIMIKNMIGELIKGKLISEEEKQKISDYLLSIEDWGYYQLTLYGNTIDAFSNTAIYALSTDVLTRTQYYKAIPQNKKLTIQVLVNTVIVYVERQEFEYARFFRDAIVGMLSETDIYERALFLFISGLVDIYSGNKEGKQKMKDAIDIFDKVGSYHLAEDCQDDYDKHVGGDIEYHI